MTTNAAASLGRRSASLLETDVAPALLDATRGAAASLALQAPAILGEVLRWWPLVVAFALALATAVALTPLLRVAALRYGWVDFPSTRKVHQDPTPRIGGIAIFAGLSVGLAAAYLFHGVSSAVVPVRMWVVWLGALVLFGTGLWDDLFGLGFKRKFFVQLVVAYAMVAAGFHFRLDGLPFFGELNYYHQLWVALPFTLLWIVGVINALNLLDGLDGLAAGIGLIAAAALAAAFATNGDVGMLVLAVALAGALAGFLVHNFNPASIFMGDSGSLVLGFLLAMYGIQGTGHADPLIALAIPIVALGLPVLDTTSTFFRRLIRKRPAFAPDDDHIHHRVLKATGSHRMAVLTLYGVAVAFGAAAVLLARGGGFRALILLAIVVGCVYALLRRLGYVRIRMALRRLYIRRLLRRRAHSLSEEEEARVGVDQPPRSAGRNGGVVRKEFHSES